MAPKRPSLSRSGSSDDGILSRISDNSIVQKGRSAACDAAYVAKRLLKSTGKAAWIAATTFIVLGIPLIIEMDREAQFTEAELQQASLLGGASPAQPAFMAPHMTSHDNSDAAEKEIKDTRENEDNKQGEEGGFLGKVKDFIQDIGEKIEETVGFGKPTADVSAVHIPHINMEKAEIVVDILVSNPNPIPIPLIDINYLIESDSRKLISGLIPDAGTIQPHGSETVKIPVCLIYDDIKSTYSDINPGSVIPYKVKVDLIVDVPVFGRLTLPLEKNGEIPIPYKPDVALDKIKFDKFSFEESVAILHLKLENKNDFELCLNDLDLEVWLCDVSIGKADLAASTKIDKNGTSYMDIPITFRPMDFGSALWDMLRGRGTGYTVKGSIDANTPFGNMKLPISKEGGETRLKKNGEDGDDDDDEE